MYKSTPTASNALYYYLVALAALILAGTTGLAVRATVGMRVSIDWVGHTYAVIERVQQIRALLGEVEAYQRGYLITGQDEYLLPYRRAADRLRQEVLELHRSVANDPPQQLRAGALRRAAIARLEYAEDTVTARAERGLDAAARRLAGGFGSNDAELARGLCDSLIVAERILLRARQDELAADIQRTNATILVANSFALFAAGIGFFMIRRSRRAWERTRLADIEAAQARAASREKSAFLASMSHEIRTPMNAIFGFAQLLAQHVRGEREQQYLRAIVTSGDVLLALINDILDLSKIEAGHMELQPVPTDVRELVDSSLAVFAQMAADKRLRLTAGIEPGIPALLLDPARLRQILFNLIGNAIKYSDQGGVTVQVRTLRTGEPTRVVLELVVHDTGIGIDAVELDRIFESFVQIKPADGVARQGSGLGLSITARLVDLMGGTISAASEPGAGSTFRVVLPDLLVVPASETVRQAATGAVDFDDLNRACVLIVDDVAWNRDLLVAMLSDSRHELFTADSGVGAVALARQHRPDVVLMDVRMPGVDGRQARDLIRADPALAAVRIVAVTASSLRGEDDTLRRDFDGFVRKPIVRADLYYELERLLGRRDGAAAAPIADAAPADAHGTAPDRGPAELTRAVARLRELEQTTWPRLRGALRMREAAAFARELEQIGAVLGARDLAGYARSLARAIDLFDVVTAESLLSRFATHASAAYPTGETA